MSARGERMLAELVDTAALTQATGVDARTAFMGAWHQALAFARDHSDLVPDLRDALDALYRDGAGPAGAPSVESVNTFLVRAARGDA